MDNRLKEEYLAMEIPELKTGIMEKVTRQKVVRTRRKLRPAAVLAAVLMLAVLSVTAGAVTTGLLQLKNGSYYTFVDADGNLVKPTGFHMEDGVDVPLSETALNNIMPYVFLYDEDETYFETADPADMEAFMERSMHLPDGIPDTACRYRLWAYGTPEYTATIFVEIVPEGAQDNWSMKVHLRGGPINILTKGTPKMETYELPDGTPVSIAIADSQQDGKIGFAFYRYEDAVYELQIPGEKNRDILERLQAMLDTVG